MHVDTCLYQDQQQRLLYADKETINKVQTSLINKVLMIYLIEYLIEYLICIRNKTQKNLVKFRNLSQL